MKTPNSNIRERRAAAKKFVEFWRDKGYERGESQAFWLALLRDVYGVEEPEKFIKFEEKVKINAANFIDARIPQTQTLIEQKRRDKDLRKPTRQSDGKLLTPFQQAKRYSAELPYSQRPRRIVACNFKEFLVYDMENPTSEPESILLENLPEEYDRLQFLVEFEANSIQKETELSIRAGELVGVLYDALLARYRDPANPRSLQSLNMFCVRLVFCLYAEDAGVFAKRQFSEYVGTLPEQFVRQGLIDLFKVLDQKAEERDPYLSPKLAAFPYVNGGLFSDENIEIPLLDQEIVKLLTQDAGDKFDWKEISPTIFGAVFESALNPETRRQGGMHYTSIENIHKVIDPLFLDDLRDEFAAIKEINEASDKNRALVAFQKKLGELRFLDPACGSGNFLTETYISLRRLENEALRLLYPEKTLFKLDDPNQIVNVSIDQFFGIEINDYAATVAQTALWIAESQTMRETEDILDVDLDFLPLKSYVNIVEGNALKIDWNDVVSQNELDYIVGNPPFVGYSLQSKEQKEDVLAVYLDPKGKPYKTAGKIDYVACWYYKACQFMQGTKIQAAFVSTNSIAQGEQVAYVWKPLVERFGVKIDFAYRTFRWDSEANLKANVYCVIVGFSCFEHNKTKRLFDGESSRRVENISFYLIDAPSVFIESRNNALCDVPEMIYGNKPTDGGFLFLTSEERDEALKNEPEIEPYIRRIYGASEYINNKERYCLWLVDASPATIRNSNFIAQRVKQVKEFRANSSKEATRKSADFPTLFQEIRQPTTSYIVVPRHSSGNRTYVPFGFVSSEIIVNDAVSIIPNATLYLFGVLTSSVHFAWMRAFCGYLGTSYRYSKDVIYNNFPWCEASEEQRTRIERTAQGILDARALYPDSSLADLYDETSMPPALRRAHRENDQAVLKAYGFLARDPSEETIVAELTRRYERLVRERGGGK